MNPILTKTKQAIEQKADPRLKPVVSKLVAAGMKVMYSEETRQMSIDALKGARDAESIGAAVAKLAGILFNQSKQTAPMQALVPAAMLLLVEGLAFLEDSGAVEVTPELVADSTLAMTSALLQLLGATPEQIQGYMQKSQGAQPAQPAQPAPAQPAGGIVTQGAM